MIFSDDTYKGKRGVLRGKRLFNNWVASDEDVQRIWTMYMQYFNSQQDGSDAVDLDVGLNSEDHIQETSAHQIWNQTDDLGVEKWRRIDDGALDSLLGYVDGRPALFSKYRSKSGLTTWDSEWNLRFGTSDMSMEHDISELLPMWHQKVGVVAMAELLWTIEPCDVPGILLADKVGLGKSAQLMMLIDLIIAVNMAEEMEKKGTVGKRPPILSEREVIKIDAS